MLGDFTLKAKDLMGRIGVLETKSGKLETPHFFPVIDPQLQGISPSFMNKSMKHNGVMTNAYLLKRHFEVLNLEVTDIHSYLDYNQIIATDSGAYQILMYGKVALDPLEIIEFQNKINTDIGVILDVPTGLTSDRLEAEFTVKETLRRAEASLEQLNPQTLWIGPIQGGLHNDLISLSTQEMVKYPFQIYGLGSPTPLLERYMFDHMLSMVILVKRDLPSDKPLHLFGAGHPIVFPLIVACGVDSFDSAAYILYAKNGRYMTRDGSIKIAEMEYFPCSCRQCTQFTPKEVCDMEKVTQIQILAEHNLWVCLQEVRRVKEAIWEGRLWELMQTRAFSHPKLHTAFKTLKNYSKEIECLSPVIKKKGLFTYSKMDLYRPEVIRHQHRFFSRCYLEEKSMVIFCPLAINLPKKISHNLGNIMHNYTRSSNVQVIYYNFPYGIIPIELEDVYPLGQTEMSFPIEDDSKETISASILRYLRRSKYKQLIFIYDRSLLTKSLIDRLKNTSYIILFDMDSPNFIRDLKKLTTKLFLH